MCSARCLRAPEHPPGQRHLTPSAAIRSRTPPPSRAIFETTTDSFSKSDVAPSTPGTTRRTRSGHPKRPGTVRRTLSGRPKATRGGLRRVGEPPRRGVGPRRAAQPRGPLAFRLNAQTNGRSQGPRYGGDARVAYRAAVSRSSGRCPRLPPRAQKRVRTCSVYSGFESRGKWLLDGTSSTGTSVCRSQVTVERPRFSLP